MEASFLRLPVEQAVSKEPERIFPSPSLPEFAPRPLRSGRGAGAVPRPVSSVGTLCGGERVLTPPAPAGHGQCTWVGSLELEDALAHVILYGALNWNVSLGTGRELGVSITRYLLHTQLVLPGKSTGPAGSLSPPVAPKPIRRSVVTVTPHGMGFCAGGNLPLGRTGFQTKQAASVWQQ